MSALVRPIASAFALVGKNELNWREMVDAVAHLTLPAQLDGRRLMRDIVKIMKDAEDAGLLDRWGRPPGRRPAPSLS